MRGRARLRLVGGLVDPASLLAMAEVAQPSATQDVTVHERYGVEVHTTHYPIRHGVPITVYG